MTKPQIVSQRKENCPARRILSSTSLARGRNVVEILDGSRRGNILAQKAGELLLYYSCTFIYTWVKDYLISEKIGRKSISPRAPHGRRLPVMEERNISTQKLKNWCFSIAFN